jgi:hypothetical protein
MTTLEQVEELRNQAISLLVAERETIDQKLQQLGADLTQPATSCHNLTKKARACSKCGSADHNARRCTVTPSISIE